MQVSRLALRKGTDPLEPVTVTAQFLSVSKSLFQALLQFKLNAYGNTFQMQVCFISAKVKVFDFGPPLGYFHWLAFLAPFP